MSIQKTYPFDIETVAIKRLFKELSEDQQRLFIKKFKKDIEDRLGSPLDYFDNKEADVDNAIQFTWQTKAGLLPEFGKVVCICVAVIDNARQMKVVTFADEDEKKVLSEFARALDKGAPEYILGHNIKGFDIPFLAKRYIINGMTVPKLLRIMGLKPWDMKWIIDTHELWQMADLRSFTSLDLLAVTLGFPSPKDVIDGSKVYDVYYADDKETLQKKVAAIGFYCCGDVEVNAKVYLRMTGQDPLSSVVRV